MKIRNYFQFINKMNYLQIILAIILSSLVAFTSNSQSVKPIAGFIADFSEEKRQGLGIRLGRETQSSPVKLEDELRPGNVLMVRKDSMAWAALGFVIGQTKDYGGLILKTIPDSRSSEYRFPCRAKGGFTIAWRQAGEKGDRACGKGVEVISDNKKKALNSNKSKSLLADVGNKQLTEETELEISPGQSQVVVRKTTINAGSELECRGIVIFNYCRTVPLEKTAVDVFVGSVTIQSAEDPIGKIVREGERFTYPGSEITPIDTLSKANTCEAQKFYNSYYWSTPSSIPESVIEGIKSQLTEHRKAVGIFGGTANLSTLEKSVIDELNLVRTDPQTYIELLKQRRQYYRGNRLELPGQTPLLVKEGVVAVDDAIRDLSAMSRPLSLLGSSQGLSKAAQDLVSQQSRTGNVGHGNISSRIERYGKWGCSYAETVSYGESEARDVVMQLIIDDGQPERGHRKIILNPDLQVAGVACGSHAQYRAMCNITYAGGYIEGEDEAQRSQRRSK